MGTSLKILSIKEALSGFKLDEDDKCYTNINDEKIEHFRIMGRVVLKFLNNEKTYGTCEATGKHISRARLEAKPWAKYCGEYSKKIESGLAAESEQ